MSLSRYAQGLLGLTFCMLLLGGVVHNTRSSLACPDWPLCFGSAFPKMEGGVLVEHSHRLLGTTIGLVTIGLLMGLVRRSRKTGDPSLAVLGWVALPLVCLQGLLGGLTVMYRLPPLVSTAHLGVSMLFFSLVLYIVFRLSPTPMRARPSLGLPLERASLVGVVLVYAQMLVGALMRHLGAGLACTDLPLCAGGVWPTGAHPNVLLHAFHRLFLVAIFVVVCVIAMIAYRTQDRRARVLATIAPLLVLVQGTLGWLSISTFLDAVPVTLHLGVAVLLLADLLSLHLVSRGSRRHAADDEEPAYAQLHGATS